MLGLCGTEGLKMRIAYFDCPSGISGDMCLGALVNAGADLKNIKKELKKIPIKGYTISEKSVRRNGISATKIDIKCSKALKPIPRWKDMFSIIQSSALSPDIKEKGLRILKSLFIAEAVVHGEPYDKIHLHELGSPDTILDVFGTLISIKELNIEKVYSSPVNLGGCVKAGHGILPLPAPAVVELLKGFSVYSSTLPYELVTPTGAALLKGLSSGSSPMPVMNLKKVGIGAGTHNIKERPNILRVFIGEGNSTSKDITVIETNIDDMSPQIYPYLIDSLLKKGAVDVFLTQVIMKKGRPGVKLTVLCDKQRAEPLIETIFRETTTLGVRSYSTQRITLKRKMEGIDTEIGRIRIKKAYLGERLIKSAPEYEDCKRVSIRYKIPLIDVIKKALTTLFLL